MSGLAPRIEAELAALPVPVAVAVPDAQASRPAGARLRLRFSHESSVAKLAVRQIYHGAEDDVKAHAQIGGALRDLILEATALLSGRPAHTDSGWWSRVMREAEARGSHTGHRHSAQAQFHGEVSGDCYALSLDPRRGYPHACFREPALDLAAQEAKRDHICRKLTLLAGELPHVTTLPREVACVAVEIADTENPSPLYARTVRAWPDPTEFPLARAPKAPSQTAGPQCAWRILRACRLYLSGCAMSFEQGRIALHQMLCVRPDGDAQPHGTRGAQSAHRFTHPYMYN